MNAPGRRPQRKGPGWRGRPQAPGRASHRPGGHAGLGEHKKHQVALGIHLGAVHSGVTNWPHNGDTEWPHNGDAARIFVVP